MIVLLIYDWLPIETSMIDYGFWIVYLARRVGVALDIREIISFMMMITGGSSRNP